MPDPCPTCGHVIEDGKGWQPSFERRAGWDPKLMEVYTEEKWFRIWGETEWRRV